MYCDSLLIMYTRIRVFMHRADFVDYNNYSEHRIPLSIPRRSGCSTLCRVFVCIVVVGASSLVGALVATANLLKSERSANSQVLIHEPIESSITSSQFAAVISKASTLNFFQQTLTNVDGPIQDMQRIDYQSALNKFRRLLEVQGSLDRKTLKLIVPEWFDSATGAFHYVEFAHDVALTLAIVLNSSSTPL